MSDVVVTVPKGLWEEWIAEGDLPCSPPSDFESHFMLGTSLPNISAGERVRSNDGVRLLACPGWPTCRPERQAREED